MHLPLNIFQYQSSVMSKKPISRQVMNPPGDRPEARNLSNSSPLQRDRDRQRRGKTGMSSRPEARPVTATARIRTETKPFGHVFNPNPSPCVPGWSCCMCGWFVEKLDDYAKAGVCGYVTYPVLGTEK